MNQSRIETQQKRIFLLARALEKSRQPYKMRIHKYLFLSRLHADQFSHINFKTAGLTGACPGE